VGGGCGYGVGRMREIFVGTDSGATTSKTCGVYGDGSPVTMELAQSSTNSQAGRGAVVEGWVAGVEKFLAGNGLVWEQVAGVGLAMPGPYQGYGVLDRSPNLPADFAGWDFLSDYKAALAAKAGREVPVVTGNDGNHGGVAEAAKVRGDKKVGVVMLAPGSGLGAAYVGADGLPLEGDTLCGMEAGHMPAPLQLLGLPVFTCGCGRDWGCVEAYASISGLPQYLEHLLPKHPGHAFHASDAPVKEKVLSLRTLAQQGDALALEIFDLQAKALGIHVANLSMALDAEYVVIGGGLIDPHATTEEFRARYLGGIRSAAEGYLFPVQRERIKVVAATMGELSQAIGAALVALYTARGRG
jgi:glucokinase